MLHKPEGWKRDGEEEDKSGIRSSSLYIAAASVYINPQSFERKNNCFFLPAIFCVKCSKRSAEFSLSGLYLSLV